MTFLIKLTYLNNSSITPYEIIYWQGAIATICFILTAKVKQIDILDIPKNLRKAWVLRGVFGALAHSALAIKFLFGYYSTTESSVTCRAWPCVARKLII